MNAIERIGLILLIMALGMIATPILAFLAALVTVLMPVIVLIFVVLLCIGVILED